MKGLFICLEGCDCTGKSTIAEFVHEKIGKDRSVLARNPGATPLGKELRSIIKSREDIEMDRFTEQLLFMADHGAFINQVLVPNIESGKHVISDRHDLVGNCAYGYAGKTDKVKLRNMRRLFFGAPSIDILFIFHCSAETAAKRAMSRNEECKIEARGSDYMAGARQVYDAVMKMQQSDLSKWRGERTNLEIKELAEEIGQMASKIYDIDANKELEEVKSQVLDRLAEEGII